MNLYEDIHHYQLLHFLRKKPQIDHLAPEPGPFVPSRTMLNWLNVQLDTQFDVLSQSLLNRIESIRAQDQTSLPSQQYLVEKGKPQLSESSNDYSLFRDLCSMIRNKQPMLISFRTRDGKTRSNVTGFPHKLTYYALRKAWYVSWQQERTRKRMTTPITLIMSVVPWVDCEISFPAAPKSKDSTNTIELQIAPDYNQDIQRIFHVLSTFNKKVTSHKTAIGEAYLIHLYYSQEDLPVLMSRLRMIGRHILVLKPAAIRDELYQTASRALNRYRT